MWVSCPFGGLRLALAPFPRAKVTSASIADKIFSLRDDAASITDVELEEAVYRLGGDNDDEVPDLDGDDENAYFLREVNQTVTTIGEDGELFQVHITRVSPTHSIVDTGGSRDIYQNKDRFVSGSQKGVPRLGTYTHTMLPPVWWYAQSAVELSWSDESRSSTRMCVLLVEGYLLQRTRDKRRAINMSPTWSRSRVVMSPGETPRDRYHPISHSPYTNRRSRKREVHVT